MAPLIEHWSNNTTGTLNAPAVSTSTSISVSTSTGTFPTLAANEVFHIIINFGQITAEICEVIDNTAGTFTLSAGLANDHDAGEQLALIITKEGLDNMLADSVLIESFQNPGDLIAGTGAGTFDVIALGATDQVLAVGGADPSGIRWVTPAASLPPSGSAGGDLTGSYPNPGVGKVAGTAVSGTPAAGKALLATSPSAAAWSFITTISGVVVSGTPATGQVLTATSTSAADWEDINTLQGTVILSGSASTGDVLTATGPTSANWAAPVGGSPTGGAGGDLSGSYPSPTVAQLQGSIVLSGTPSTGQVLTATSPSAAQWAAPAGGAPSGSAGGDLGGSYPNPSVAQLQGSIVLSGTPSTGQVLTATSPTAADWQTPSGGGGGGHDGAQISGFTVIHGGNVLIATTISLGVGYWGMVCTIFGAYGAGATAPIDLFFSGTGTSPTILGPQSVQGPDPSVALTTQFSLVLTTSIHVTTPDTQQFRILNHDSAQTFTASTSEATSLPAMGYYVFQIA